MRSLLLLKYPIFLIPIFLFTGPFLPDLTVSLTSTFFSNLLNS